MSDYADRRIAVSAGAIRIRGYYLPWGSKTVPCDAIRSARRVSIGALSGRGRIWGTANPRYWANFDPRRPRKQEGFVLDTGGLVHPVLTPDDPDAFESAVSSCGVSVSRGGRGVFM